MDFSLLVTEQMVLQMGFFDDGEQPVGYQNFSKDHLRQVPRKKKDSIQSFYSMLEYIYQQDLFLFMTSLNRTGTNE